MGTHSIGHDGLRAAIRQDGAELSSLVASGAGELIWPAAPAWPRHAPILFPIVGRLKGDRLLHDGRSHTLTQHGFARDRMFTWTEQTATSCRLLLQDDAETRALYPFPFRLEIGYAVQDDRLQMDFVVTNPGDAPLPVSVGAHPAFRWPLADGIAKAAHCLDFAQDEPAPIRRVAGGLLTAQPEPSPIAGRTLALTEALFASDAIILDQPASRSLRYTAPGAPVIEIGWQGFRELGLWSKPGADFLCIEPWHGFASPVGWDQEFATKPGLMHLAPGEQRLLSITFTITTGGVSA